MHRYVSTLVWVPRMHPEKFSTTLIVSPEEATFTDAIYIKVIVIVLICIKVGYVCVFVAELRIPINACMVLTTINGFKY